MQNSPEILYAKDDSWLWAWLEDEKKRRAAQGIKEEPPFNPEEARELFRKYKAKQEINQRLRAKMRAGETLPAERRSAEMVEVVLSE